MSDRYEPGPGDEECPARCGYFDQGQSLADHVRYEHRPCRDCGAGNGDGQDAEYLRTYSLAHRQNCPRLRPGYKYPVRPDGETDGQ